MPKVIKPKAVTELPQTTTFYLPLFNTAKGKWSALHPEVDEQVAVAALHERCADDSKCRIVVLELPPI
jgi:hypothetical protein